MRYDWSEDKVRDACSEKSYAKTLKRLNIPVSGSNYSMLKQKIKEYGIDTSHMTHQGHNLGKKIRSDRNLDSILVENSTYTSTHHLKNRLLSLDMLERRCYNCGITEWMGKKAPLQLDHINGIRSDNRIENLRILCPNCHAQTDTWTGKNKPKYPNR